MCQRACPFCLPLINLAPVLKAALYKLNLSIIVGFQIKLPLIKIFLWAVKESVANRCTCFPLAPVVFLLVKMLHDFFSIDIL